MKKNKTQSGHNKTILLKIYQSSLLIEFTIFALLSSCISPPSTFTPAPPMSPPGPAYYVDSDHGSDSNPGSQAQPWKTLRKAIRTLPTGSTLYIRGGEYGGANSATTAGGSQGFINSGTETSPITVTNYPGEAVTIRVSDKSAFSCWWREEEAALGFIYNKANYIRIIGTNVPERTLSNGVKSVKGIVIQGNVPSFAIFVAGCDNWEVAGIDFVDTSSAIRTWKYNYSKMVDNSADNMYVHDNRVYGYGNESGMQFNGNHNLIENNEIVKVTPRLDTSFGCQLINILGHGSTIRGNTLTGTGGTECIGIRLEYSQSDANLIENNTITGVPIGIDISGGDNNIIRNNTIISAIYNGPAGGIEINSQPENTWEWPCTDSLDNPNYTYTLELLPPNNPNHPDYPYYYPHDCQSYGNQIIGNKISGFSMGVKFQSFAPTIGTTIITNNIITGWTIGTVCNYSNGLCKALPSNVVIDSPANTPGTMPSRTSSQ